MQVMSSGKHSVPRIGRKMEARVQESHHPCTLRTHSTIRIRLGGNPGVMVHLHTPIKPNIRHLQESSVLKEADYLEEEEEEDKERGQNIQFLILPSTIAVVDKGTSLHCYYVKMCRTGEYACDTCSTHFYIIAVKGCSFVYHSNCWG